MRTTLVISAFAALIAPARAAFGPNVRVDHENRPGHGCYHAAIALGPPEPAGQTVYVAIENDSFAGIVVVRSDIYFQRSTDYGRTWLSEDRLIRRGSLFACYPDIAVGRDGSIYIVYTERTSGASGHFWCVHSTDDGETWSSPAQIDDNPS
ncbi:exo-alpha-sialidase, partial [candidate division WOR-3 bacterium]|nr:exo-alpha-sialidase [candidate division WOR-3 bacterium]